ncbi:hypothetical protein DOTSEDRAFT_177572 [Dothistroma septosporum NZE10]|uniref:RING-type domain-containing protein n=1 Tax=Dothistroma septosporum (strain NZE10 / CBS 128990) TaxID=675120 RepID=N1PG27_DOTSN|nr:hypothetical protein DOTSEDRAFT_177572 [Dothistroma septosporum NZE10]
MDESSAKRPRYCTNCYNNVPPHRWPKEHQSTTCKHPNQVCKTCWKDWLLFQVDYHRSDRISCISCRATLSQEDVKVFAGMRVHGTYLDLAARNAVGGMEEFAWCLGKGGGSGQIHHGRSHGFECGVCKHRHCTICNLPWSIEHRRHCERCQAPEHEGKTCEEAATAHAVDERATIQAMKEIAEECPGCQRRIEKEDDGGCDWISCTKCQHEFCWICLASHKEIKSKGNEAHKEECSYHSVGKPLAFPFSNH